MCVPGEQCSGLMPVNNNTAAEVGKGSGGGGEGEEGGRGMLTGGNIERRDDELRGQ